MEYPLHFIGFATRHMCRRVPSTPTTRRRCNLEKLRWWSRSNGSFVWWWFGYTHTPTHIYIYSIYIWYGWKTCVFSPPARWGSLDFIRVASFFSTWSYPGFFRIKWEETPASHSATPRQAHGKFLSVGFVSRSINNAYTWYMFFISGCSKRNHLFFLVGGWWIKVHVVLVWGVHGIGGRDESGIYIYIEL